MEREHGNNTLPYVIQIATRNLLYEPANQAEALQQPSVVGWGGIWEGVQEEGDICIPMAVSKADVWQKTMQYGKVIIIQLKINIL